MDILEESRMMLELAISSLQRAGHDTEHFERTVDKIRQEQVQKLNTDDVSNCSCISRDTLTPEARKMFDDIDKALERKK